MNFTFDGDVAKEYGVPEAILFYNIAFWEKQNRLNKHNCFEGRYWTYNTLKAYTGLFYFISEATIKRALKHLKDEGLILAGNFENDRFNHTNYYTLSDKGMEIVQNCTNRIGQNDLIGEVNLSLSILKDNSDSNTDINNTIKNECFSPDVVSQNVAEKEAMFEEFWKAYPKCFRKVDKKGCKAKFVRIKNLKELFPDILASLELQKRSKQWNEKDGQFIPMPATWINQERWTIEDEKLSRQAIIEDIAKKNMSDFLL